LANDPIHQFQVSRLIPIDVGGLDLSFTNVSAFMVATVVLASGFLYFTSSSRGLVPSRLQSVSEMAYEFVASSLRDSAGSKGMKFFPFVFSLFMFVLVANFIGLFPYFYTVTSQIIVTFALSLLVIGTVIIYASSSCSYQAAFRASSCRWLLPLKSFRSSRAQSASRFVFSRTCWQATSRSRFSQASLSR
jgi:F0F1-type ATP synthase membrane subunit a